MAKQTEFSWEVAKKYVFWASLPIGLIIAIVVTFLGVSSTSSEFVKRKQELESQRKNVDTISKDRAHPNQRTIDDINASATVLTDKVSGAWLTLEKDQRTKNRWPDLRSQIFTDEVTSKKFGTELTMYARELYLNFLEREYLAGLEYMVDRRRVKQKVRVKNTRDQYTWEEVNEVDKKTTQAVPGYDVVIGGITLPQMGNENIPSRGGEDEMWQVVGTVDWPDPETRTIIAHWGSVPWSMEVWYAQEDLWVYSALLSVIRATNSKATGPHNAVVKKIESLSIGQAASGDLASRSARRLGAGGMGDGLMPPPMGGPGGFGGPGAGGSPGGPEGSEAGLSKGGRAANDADAEKTIRHLRYVDKEAKPLPFGTPAPYAQFNRMPVRLKLIVDQRHIQEILVNCANSAMPIDVLWIDLNPQMSKPFELSAHSDVAIGGTEGGGGGGGGGGSPMGGGGGSRSRPSPGGGPGTGGGQGTDSTPGRSVEMGGMVSFYGSESIGIEIYGCINIFNAYEFSEMKSKATPPTVVAP